MSTPQTQPTPQPVNRGIVKQVLSGDTVVIRGIPKGGPPPERTLSFSYLNAPKLAKRAQPGGPGETQDEPWAWEAREFLRKKLIGQNVMFTVEKPPAGKTGTREYGTVYLPTGPGQNTPDKAENMSQSVVKEGLVTVRRDIRQPPPELQVLLDLQEEAKANHRGRHAESANPQDHVRNIKWNIDNMMSFVEKLENKPVKAIIENVRDGSTVRAFLLPDFYYVTLMMSGIRCPSSKLDSDGRPDPSVKMEHADEAKYFTEVRLLHHEVEIVLESVNGSCFVGTILHPKGNIAEELLKGGYAKCLDWSIAKMKKGDADRLRQAEKLAKEKRLKVWKDWTPPPQINDKEFSGIVMEVVNGDALMIKQPNGNIKKVFLASIRPPRDQGNMGGGGGGEENGPKKGKSRPLYDIPWLFEAREFLRKKLIGKKVNVLVDYIQPARDSYPEKICATITIASVNVAEAMVSKGLATVVRYRQNDDLRATGYDGLLAAEMKAQKGQKGLHAKKDNTPIHRVNDYSGDSSKAKQLFPHLSRESKTEAVVEFVTSGSRMRLFLPKHSSLITFLISGIEVRYNEGDGINNEDAALQFTREKCMQRDVEVRVESMDRAGNFIGWLWVDGSNLSVSLVEHGLAKIHFSGESSEFGRQLKSAKDAAKAKGLWKYAEKEEGNKETVEEERVSERRIDYKEVMVVVTREAGFYGQYVSQGPKLDQLQAKLTQELTAQPPLPGAYTPKKGDTCAAKFVDGGWYRAKVEKVSGGKAAIFYMDYGNRTEVPTSDCAPLPPSLAQEKGYAHQFALACVQLPKDADYIKEAEAELWTMACNQTFLMNFEYNNGGVQYVTLVDPKTKEDVGKNLVSMGLLLVDRRKERKLQKLIGEYISAEEEAKKKRRSMWEYGDIREDDDKEFGLGR